MAEMPLIINVHYSSSGRLQFAIIRLIGVLEILLVDYLARWSDYLAFWPHGRL